jgi:hypothetical protein
LRSVIVKGQGFGGPSLNYRFQIHRESYKKLLKNCEIIFIFFTKKRKIRVNEVLPVKVVFAGNVLKKIKK